MEPFSPGPTGQVLLGLSALLALVGAWTVLLKLGRVLGGWGVRSRTPACVGLLVLVKNQERAIEGVVRTLAGWILHGHLAVPNGAVVVDVGSTDDTLQILDRLARRPGGVRIVRLAAGQPLLEAGLFLCRAPVVVVVDLQQGADPAAALAVAKRLLAGGQAPGKQGTVPASAVGSGEG